MTLKRNHLLALSAILATVTPLGFNAAPTLANPDTSVSVLARTQDQPLTDRLDAIASTFSYPFEQRTATTLYIDKLPVLTFLDTGETTPETSAESLAQQVSQILNHLFSQTDFDPTKFTISEQLDGQYLLLYGADPVVILNDAVSLADSTGNLDQDALIAVNRLRRLMGGAAPLQAIARPPAASNQTTAKVTTAPTAATKVVSTQQGRASWYGPGFHGRRTANGERFDQNALTAAHKTLPFGTKVRVTNVSNGRSVVVRINDRGPYSHGRVIDLSKGSAQQIGLVSMGVGTVKLEVLEN